MSDLWVLKYIGPGWRIDHPASPAEILAAARLLPGAEEGERCAVHHGDYRGNHTQACEFRPVLVVPLSDIPPVPDSRKGNE